MMAMLRTGLLALTMMLLATTAVRAAPVTYIFVGDIVGTLGSTAVNGELTLTVTGDTDNLATNGPGQFLETGAVSIFSLAGVGSFVITNSSYVFARPDAGFVGFGVRGLPNCCDIIQIFDSEFLGYDLNNAIGPVLGLPNPSLADWVDVPTTAGLFTVTSMTDNTFQAVIGTASVPEPSTPALLALAGAGAWLTRRRKPTTATTGAERAN